jgi:hypothetical protein
MHMPSETSENLIEVSLSHGSAHIINQCSGSSPRPSFPYSRFPPFWFVPRRHRGDEAANADCGKNKSEGQFHSFLVRQLIAQQRMSSVLE